MSSSGSGDKILARKQTQSKAAKLNATKVSSSFFDDFDEEDSVEEEQEAAGSPGGSGAGGKVTRADLAALALSSEATATASAAGSAPAAAQAKVSETLLCRVSCCVCRSMCASEMCFTMIEFDEKNNKFLNSIDLSLIEIVFF